MATRCLLRAVLAATVACGAAVPAGAHPMPNSLIAVSLRDDGAIFDVAVPVPELRLALPSAWPRSVDLLAEPQRTIVQTYFQDHVSVRSKAGVPQASRIESLAVSRTSDENVGQYEELRVHIFAPANASFDPHDFVLAYDAVIHQVPNHFALVEIAQDFRGGRLPEDGASPVGVIRFDFRRNLTPAMSITTARGSVLRGFQRLATLGFWHVATGYDHVLFLLTLLFVAPLAVVERRWSLFQGWGYAIRRFLAISMAFTLGHSVALLAGAYRLVAVPRDLVEVLIAASILVAAIHAVRPLFSGREWIVAAVFGTVHGLAFAGSLAGLSLTPGVRAVAVFGFNVGVEGAQLTIMLLALPLLIASRSRSYHFIRFAGMAVVAGLAVTWMCERAAVWYLASRMV